MNPPRTIDELRAAAKAVGATKIRLKGSDEDEILNDAINIIQMSINMAHVNNKINRRQFNSIDKIIEKIITQLEKIYRQQNGGLK